MKYTSLDHVHLGVTKRTADGKVPRLGAEWQTLNRALFMGYIGVFVKKKN